MKKIKLQIYKGTGKWNLDEECEVPSLYSTELVDIIQKWTKKGQHVAAYYMEDGDWIPYRLFLAYGPNPTLIIPTEIES